MVVSNTGVTSALLSDDQVDLIFHALADATRRDIVRQSIDGELSVSGLARLYPISTTAIQKHVAVLEQAQLVRRTRRGREQLVTSRSDTVALAKQLLDEIEQLWRVRIDQIDQLLDNPSGEPACQS